MTYKTLKLIEQDDMAQITFDQPNLDVEMIAELKQVLEYLEDESNSHFLLLRGQNGVFCNGLKFDNIEEAILVDINRWEKVVKMVQNINKLTVAVIDGICSGAGIHLALACDLRIASDSSVFSHNELSVGFLPGSTVMQLGKYCGLGRTMELLQTGASYSAMQAVEMGIINYCASDVQKETYKRINQYSQFNPKLHHLTRRLVREAFEMSDSDFLGCCQAAQHQAIISHQSK